LQTDGRFLFAQRLQEVEMTVTALDSVEVGGRTLTYREAGEGPAVLLLHGWPTSSFLWRDVMPAIARERRVLALDLPGFGGSDKPTDVTYTYRFYTDAVGGFLDAVGADDVALGVHDLGGPVGVRFALDNPDRVRAVALTNTLLYPEDTTEMLTNFVEGLRTPGLRERFTSAEGLEAALRLGTNDESSASAETIAGMVEPFGSDEDRLALAKAGVELEDDVTEALARELPGLRMPVRVVYGTGDRILESIGDTVARIQRDLPQAEVTALDGLGHYLQEDDPERVGELLAEFFART
jgi:pimeloyl-ACP methyl ester carboxylesterase